MSVRLKLQSIGVSLVVEKGCVVGVVFSEVVGAIVDVFGLVVVDGL